MKKIDYNNSIIVLNDSLCQTFNKNLSLEDCIMAYYLQRRFFQEGLENTIAIDCGSLALNKQHNVSEFLKNNLSVAEIKATQLSSLKSVRKDLITRLAIARWYDNFYHIDEVDSNIRISDTIKNSKNCNVVLSAVANDLMASVWANPISIAISNLPFSSDYSSKRFDILYKDEKLKNSVVDGLKRNVEEVLGINDKAKICLLGIFVPNILPKKYEEIIYEINKKVEEIAKNYKQNFADINDVKSRLIDFHPNAENFKIMCEKVYEALKNTQEEKIKCDDFHYSDRGLEGMIQDLNNLYYQEIETVKKTIDYLISKGYTEDYLKLIMDDYIKGRPREINEHIKICEDSKRLINKLKH